MISRRNAQRRLGNIRLNAQNSVEVKKGVNKSMSHAPTSTGFHRVVLQDIYCFDEILS